MMLGPPASAIAAVVPSAATDDAGVDGISFSAWVALAEPGDRLVYHRGFLSVDVAEYSSRLTTEARRTLRDIAATALRAANANLVHLVQTRLGPNQFVYIAVARPKPKPRRSTLREKPLLAAE